MLWLIVAFVLGEEGNQISTINDAKYRKLT